MEQSIGTPALWGGFVAFVLAMLALDLGVFHRKAHAVSFKEAGTWSAVWVSLSLLFDGLLFWRFGQAAGLEFLTGYVIEKSLSVDNIFVFVVIFGALRIPPRYQHRVLFWGILSALVLRAGMIFAGVALLERFHGLIYVFGAFLVVTGLKIFRDWRRGEDAAPVEGRLMRGVRRVLPTSDTLEGPHFFTRRDGRSVATPLFLALVLVESSDVLFALDSIPAIFAVTRDPFIVFTSNIFAILGLRSLFFLLAGMVERFHYLKVGLAGVLVFVGLKMVAVQWVKVPALWSLGVIALVLGASVWASFRHARRHPPREVRPGSPAAPPPSSGGARPPAYGGRGER